MSVKGYKVFNSDWSCTPQLRNKKQYSCPGMFTETGDLEICGHGMHFCENLLDCFYYYELDERKKVAEVIAHGNVKTDGIKSCTDKLEIVKELSWKEVYDIINFGKRCIGKGNSGHENKGNWNTGNRNNGNRNVGNDNIGYGNLEDFNVGYKNTGEKNIGGKNTGDKNIGYQNTGNSNIGNQNVGDWNITDCMIGCFNTIPHQNIYLFNKLSNWSLNDWEGSRARIILNSMPNLRDSTNKDDECHFKKMARSLDSFLIIKDFNFIKKLQEQSARQEWWNILDEDDKNTIKNIPNFDSEIFKEITGIDVNK